MEKLVSLRCTFNYFSYFNYIYHNFGALLLKLSIIRDRVPTYW
jgi:hypothetical protein